MQAEIARGGMGRVVRMHDRRLNRDVAVKETLSPSPEQLQRFEREILLTARLQHPAIVTIHNAGRWPDGQPFYEMELVSGRPLDRVVEDARSLADRLALIPSILTVVEALAYAHGERVIHRDLKPSNVMLGRFGEVVVLDWGLAKDLAAVDVHAEGGSSEEQAPGRSGAETVAGAILGTPCYMPPEQAAGRRATERSDVYSLGAMLYHVLAGAPPYEKSSARDIVAAVLAGPPASLRKLLPEAPAELCAIVEKAMARNPADRYPTAKEMADDLRRFQTGQLVGSHRYTTGELLRRWVRRHRPLVGALAAILLVGAFALVQVVRALHQQEAALAGEQAEAKARGHAEKSAEASELNSLQVLAVRALAEQHLREAATYLVKVYKARKDDPDVRFLVAQAMRGIDPLTRTIAVGSIVEAVALSQDGNQVASGSYDGDVRLWDPHTGSLLRTMAGHSGRVLFLDYCKAGAPLLASASADHTIRIWDPTSGILQRSLEGHLEAVNQVAFSADCHQLLSAGADGTAKIWDVDTGALRLSIQADPTEVSTAVFSPDDARVVTGGTDSTVKIWDAHSGVLLSTLAGLRGLASAIAYRPDGSQIAGASHNMTAVTLWDAHSGEIAGSLSGGNTSQITSLSYSGDGKHLLATTGEGLVRLFDVDSQSDMLALEGHRGYVWAGAIGADGQTLATGGEDGTIRLWSTPAESLPVIAYEDAIAGTAAFSPDGRRVVIPSSDGMGRILDATTGALQMSLKGHTDGLETASFSPDGRRVLTAGDDGTARIWDAQTGAPLLTMQGEGGVVFGAVFSPDGSRVLTGGQDQTAKIWDSATGQPLATLTGHAGILYSVAYDASGGRIITASRDGTARVWDARTNQTILTIGNHQNALMSAAFSPDGSQIVTASTDGTARTWDATTGAALQTLVGHGDAMSTAEFSPDGLRVVTACNDGTVAVWDARSGDLVDEVLVEPQGASIQASGATFSPDGTRILATGNCPTRILDVHLESRSPDEIASLVAARSTYRLKKGKLTAEQAPH
jgi:WD40 repeat protein